MKRPYQITAILFLILCTFIAIESLKMRYYTSLGPGPGFFPFWISIILGVLAAIMLFQATFQRSDPMPAGFFATRVGYLRVAIVTLVIIANVVFLVPLGFRITTLCSLLILLLSLGRQNLIVSGFIALGGSFGVYHIFVEWLSIPLPTGIF